MVYKMMQFTFLPYSCKFNFAAACLYLALESASGGRYGISHSTQRLTAGLNTKCFSSFPSQRSMGNTVRPWTKNSIWMNIRGGMTSKDHNKEDGDKVASKVEKKKRRKKKSKSIDDDTTTKSNRREIQKAMAKTTDVAEILGQEIRNRREILLSDHVSLYYDASMSSLGHAMGMSVAAEYDDDSTQQQKRIINDDDDDAETITSRHHSQDSTRIRLENYFIKSHNGLYLIQTLSSLMASVLGIWCVTLVLHPEMTSSKQLGATTSSLPFVLMRRCLLAAMAKHIAGFCAVILLSASQIRSIGLYQTRKRMTQLLNSAEEGPIAQYLFYCALLLVWTRPGKTSIIPWFMSHVPLVLCLLGPILIREVIHVAWVISDVMLIISLGKKEGVSFIIHSLHNAVATVFNGWMSLLVGAETWSNSDSAVRQRILSHLVSRFSFLMELFTGCLLLLDSMRKCGEYGLIIPGSQRPPLIDVLKGIFCARLYIHYFQLKVLQPSKKNEQKKPTSSKN